jgi:DNA-binding transcriptional regulator/RsmH inhibitor MraZ
MKAYRVSRKKRVTVPREFRLYFLNGEAYLHNPERFMRGTGALLGPPRLLMYNAYGMEEMVNRAKGISKRENVSYMEVLRMICPETEKVGLDSNGRMKQHEKLFDDMMIVPESEVVYTKPQLPGVLWFGEIWPLERWREYSNRHLERIASTS